MLRTILLVVTLTSAPTIAAPLHGQAGPDERAEDLPYSIGAFAGFATGFTLSGLATHPEFDTVRLYRNARGGLLYGAEATARIFGPLELVGSLARSRVSTIESDSAGVWLGRAAAALSPDGFGALALTAGIALLRSQDMPVPTTEPSLHHAYVIGLAVEERGQPWPGVALRFSVEDYMVRWDAAAVADEFEAATGIRPELELDGTHALALRFGLAVLF